MPGSPAPGGPALEEEMVAPGCSGVCEERKQACSVDASGDVDSSDVEDARSDVDVEYEVVVPATSVVVTCALAEVSQLGPTRRKRQAMQVRNVRIG